MIILKNALIIGAGNIGRGVLGLLLDNSQYNLEFYDVDFDKMKDLESKGSYSVFVAEEEPIKHCISNFKVVKDGELEDAIYRNNMIFCCVYEGAFPSIAKTLAKSIQRKHIEGAEDMNVMLCVNSLRAPQIFTNLVEEELNNNLEYREYFSNHVGINQVMVLSAGLPISDDFSKEDPFSVMITPNPHIEIDGNSFKGEKPAIKNIEFVSNAEGRIYRKVYVGNMRHTMAAFMGANKGYTFIYEAQKNPDIYKCIVGAFNESHQAIKSEYTFDQDEDKSWENYMNDKLTQEIKDPIERVTANPIIKLSNNERFIGPAKLCLQHNIIPFYICMGIAYGISYLIKNDPSKNLKHVLEEICELNSEKDYILYQLIQKQYELIQ